MQKRFTGFIFISLIVGAMVGGLIGQLLGVFLPEGVVRDFLLASIFPGFEIGPIDLSIIQFEFSFHMTLNFVSLIGLSAVYYFLRYLR